MKLMYQVSKVTADEFKRGIKHDDKVLSCLFCEKKFEAGRIYQSGDLLLTHERAAAEHVESAHGGALRGLASLPKEVNGLSDAQRELILELANRKSDREIARAFQKAESTVRNQRYQLRKKVAEAKILTAIGDILDSMPDDESDFIEYHSDIPSADDRVVTTRGEGREIIQRYFESIEPLKLERFPKKQKEKLVVLKRIAREFTANRDYTEKEINDVLIAIYSDYVTVRRYLVEYRFLEREAGGKRYWLHAKIDT